MTDPSSLSTHLHALLRAALADLLPGIDLERVEFTRLLDDREIRALLYQYEHERAINEGEKVESLVAEIQEREQCSRRVVFRWFRKRAQKKPGG